MKAAALIPLTRRALGEVLLIFLGITLALMFENWNSARERKLQELNLLAELYLDLEETRIDLERDIVSTERGLESGRLMLDAFNGEPVSADEFGKAYASGIVRGRLFAKTSAYESIKTIGLDLVENNALRKLVADVHELFLSRIMIDQSEVEADIQLYRDYGGTLFVFPQRIEFARDSELQALDADLEVAVLDSIRPADYAAVLGDQGVRLLLVRLFNQAAEIRGRYLALQDAITEAERQIRAELAANGRSP